MKMHTNALERSRFQTYPELVTNVSTHCDRYAINSDGYLQILSIFATMPRLPRSWRNHESQFAADAVPRSQRPVRIFEKDAVCYRSAIQLPNKKTSCATS